MTLDTCQLEVHKQTSYNTMELDVWQYLHQNHWVTV